MDSMLIRLVVLGLMIACLSGCSTLNQRTGVQPDEPQVVEEDIADETQVDETASTQPTPPPYTEGSPAPPVEELTPPAAPPAERPPRRLIWRDRQGWKPGDSEGATDRQ